MGKNRAAIVVAFGAGDNSRKRCVLLLFPIVVLAFARLPLLLSRGRGSRLGLGPLLLCDNLSLRAALLLRRNRNVSVPHSPELLGGAQCL